MGKHAVEGCGRGAELLAQLVRNLRERTDGEREHVVPLKNECRNREHSRLRFETRSSVTIDERCTVAVRPEDRVRFRSITFSFTNNNRTGTIAEKDAAATVAPIYDARKRLRTNHKGFCPLVDLRPAASLLNRIHEPGACGLKIVSAGTFASKSSLHQTCRGRERGVVGRGSRNDDKAYIIRQHTSRFKRSPSGLCGHGRGAVILFRYVAGAYACMRVNPLVICVKRLRQVIIRDDLRRQIASCAEYLYGHSFNPPKINACIL